VNKKASESDIDEYRLINCYNEKKRMHLLNEFTYR